jgi:MFS family permease
MKVNDKIVWNKLYPLLALEVAVIVSWIAYHEFQPQILQSFGLDSFTLPYLSLQAIVMLLAPVVAGYFADKIRHRDGKMLPFLLMGINTVSMVFMSVALMLVFEPNAFTRSVLPLFFVLWLISMNLFRSPSTSLLEIYVPQNQLPKVVAVYILVINIAYAIEPSIIDILSFFGEPLTFFAGGLLVFGSGFWVYTSGKNRDIPSVHQEIKNDTKDGKTNYPRLFTYAIGFGLASSFVFKVLPDIFEQSIGQQGIASSLWVSGLVVLSAVIVLVLSKFSNEKVLSKWFNYGAALLAVSSILTFFYSDILIAVVASLAISFAFALMSISALPLVFYALNKRSTILGVGLFYGIGEFFESLLEIFNSL